MIVYDNLYNFKTFKRNYMIVIFSIKYRVITRGMISSKCIFAMRALHYGLNAMTNNDVINNLDKNNHRPLATSLAKYSQDNNQGVAQHKTAIIHHITSQQFPIEDVFEPVIQGMSTALVKYIPHGVVDARFIKEAAIIPEFIHYYGNDINWLMVTNDTPASFPNQRQPNVDFWVSLKAIGNALIPKVVPHDEKSGRGIFRHTTGGSIGIVNYDHKGEIIQVTRDPITWKDLIDYNEDRVAKIPIALHNDGLNVEDYQPMFDKHKAVLQVTIKDRTLQEVIRIHNEFQRELWNNIQRDPKCNRSVSLIFIKQMEHIPLDNQELAFQKRFIGLLGDKMYDLNKPQDAKDIYRATLISYRDVYDKDCLKKMIFLKQNGITFSNPFLQELMSMLKI